MNNNHSALSLIKGVVIRPLPFAQELVAAIEQQKGYAYALPMQKITPLAIESIISQLQIDTKIDSIIVTSRFAAIHTTPVLKRYWKQFNNIKKWYCLGEGTSVELSKFGITAIYPQLGSTSECLLKLNEFNSQSVRKSNILIVKGNSGRKRLWATLKERQANIFNLESYTREAINYSQQEITRLFNKYNFNCIVCGNHGALKNLCNFLPISYRNKYMLILPSPRQVKLAVNLGFDKSFHTNSVAAKSIIAKLHEQQTILRLKDDTKKQTQ